MKKRLRGRAVLLRMKTYSVAIGRPLTVHLQAPSAKEAERLAVESDEGEIVYHDDGYVLIGHAVELKS